jgi:transposase
MGRLENLGCATVSRIYTEFTERKAAERLSLECPLMLGIDEHTLHKKTKFATTFCDLANNRIFDVVEGKSAADLEDFLSKLKGRKKVKMVCIDLCSAFRSLVRRYFPNAILVADRFHVVRVVLHHFIQLARELAPRLSYAEGSPACCAKRPRSFRLLKRSALKPCFKTTLCSGLCTRKCIRFAICSI